jgi:multiple sugar transport system permease protein
MSALVTRRLATTFDESKARLTRKRLLMTWGVTTLAVALAAIWLMPLAYAGVTSLKTASQATQAPILPSAPETFEYEGRTYEVFVVPFEDGERELALANKGRESSEFLDPADPEAGLIQWEGRWRTLEPVRSLSFAWGNYPEAWEKIGLFRHGCGLIMRPAPMGVGGRWVPRRASPGRGRPWRSGTRTLVA